MLGCYCPCDLANTCDLCVPMGRVDKLDSSFSRSRSSSMSSLENISSEAIQCLAFADSYTKKTEPTLLVPTLWVGTSLGSVVTIMIIVPDAEQRSSQPVVVSLVGATIFRLKGSILGLSFLDCNGSLIPYSYESWRDENREKKDRKFNNLTIYACIQGYLYYTIIT